MFFLCIFEKSITSKIVLIGDCENKNCEKNEMHNSFSKLSQGENYNQNNSVIYERYKADIRKCIYNYIGID